MRSREEAHRKLEEVIRAEKAATLGRAGERLERALRDVDRVRRALDGIPSSPRRQRLLDEYRQARARALDARHTLLIQREAIGLRNHRTVDQHFPEPPAIET